MLDFINKIIYNNKELKGEDDGDESLNNSPPNALKCSLAPHLLTTKQIKRDYILKQRKVSQMVKALDCKSKIYRFESYTFLQD